MKNKNKIIILIITFICTLIITLTTFFSVRYYFDNKITFIIKDTLPDGNGKKATVILLGGQSNASGCSHDEYLQLNVSKEKHFEYNSGYKNIYINYLSGQNISNEFVKCSTKQGEIDGCFGPELGMAEKLNELYPDQLFFIIKCAWGGTNLYEQWLSPANNGKTGKLYKQFVTFVNTSLKYLESKNYDIQIGGMCWMQGESDSFSTEHATKYETHLSNFIKDIRKEFSKYSSNNEIAFIDATIANNPAFWVYCDLINQSKNKVAKESKFNRLIDTSNLIYSNEPFDNPDRAHYDSLSEIKLGHMFIEELANFLE